MSWRDCIEAITVAAGRALSHDEIERIVDEVQRRVEKRVTAGEDRLGASTKVGKELAGEEMLAALIERRQAANNVLIRQGLDARVEPGREAQDVRALLTGVNKAFKGAGQSVDALRHALRDQMLGGLIRDLRQAGVLQALRRRDKEFDRDVARELWRMDDPTVGASTGNKFAEDAANVLHQYQESLRVQLNEAGAWIGKLDHYVTRQSHDMFKVRGDGTDAAFQAWRDAILPALDPRTFDGRTETPDTFLKSVWNALSSGVHEGGGDEVLAGYKGPANLAKRASQERVLHFRDADSWFDYNARFGRGAVVDSIFHQLERGTRDLALMRTFGANPEAMFKGWVDGLRDQAVARSDFKTSDKLKGTWNDRILDVVTGKADIPANVTLGKIGSMVRAVESLSRLGGVVLSSIPDLGVNAGMLRHNGIGLFESYAREMHALIPEGAETREIAESLGVGIDGMVGAVAHRFRAEDGALGKMGKAVEFFHKLNGLSYWTDSLKTASGLMLSSNLARNAGREFAELEPRLQATLRRYGIEAGEWDAIRATKQAAADGRDYILPAHIEDAKLRDLAQTYITDQVREGMSEPTAGGRLATVFGTQHGTPGGEALRLLMQFKTYTVTFMERTLAREAFRYGKLDVGGVAHLIASTTALGYLAMTLKELAKGRNPREPETKDDYRKLVMAAMAQGGGLGIYGDFLFGEANRLGGGILATFAGPTLGTLEDAHRLFTSIRDGTGHPAAEATRALANNTPFINLFYTRMALDHLVLFRLQEMMNPGYLRRFEQRVKRENNQTFWLSPSATAF